jgi:Glycosyl hydrolases family 43
MKLSEIRMRDPFIVESAPGEFTLFGTTDTNLWGGPATGFDCYQSNDFENWTGPTAAFRPPADFWADTQYWAPEVHQVKGAFFMFATFATAAPRPKVRGVAILRSDDIAGPYLPWSDGPITPIELPCLDGTLYTDEAGQHWLVYSRGAESSPTAPGIADGEMYALPLTSDLKAAAGEPILLFYSSDAPWSKPLWFPPGVNPPEELGLAKDPLFTDGAFLVKTEFGTLLMLWSAFGEEGYAIGVAKSESGSVLGPWIQESEPLWARNGGHGMVLETSAGETYLVFHAPNDTPNERVVTVPLHIGEDTIKLLG